jgi:putative ABC transport system substrate-binding protein
MRRRELLGRAAGFVGAGTVAAAPAGQAALAAAGPRLYGRYRIYMCVFRGWTDTDRGFRDYLERRRVPVDLVVRDAEGDNARLKTIAAEIKAAEPHLVYCWGTSVALGILGRHDDPDRGVSFVADVPAVFCNVSRPIASRLVRDLNPSGTNVTGSTYLIPLDAQLATIRSYRPFRRLGALFNRLEDNSIQTVRELEQVAPGLGFEVVSREVPIAAADGLPDPAAVAPLVRELKAERAELLYIPPDSFLSRHRHDLTGAAIDAYLPTFAAAEGTLGRADGKVSRALMGLVNRYYTVGQLAGWQAEQILVKGVAPGTMPVAPLARPSLVIDIDTALALDVPPPMLMLRMAELVRWPAA